ncbi:hypothetical protein [Corynebacterium sp. 13CS0277]|uniref:hypothetical protein n=1 Tax=Corynebacterium sp. 13CS0277 TaxID=2071994 RepID=UPI001304C114|nr:hypothetical protein [Corynebacterium sp. 13CS0277]
MVFALLLLMLLSLGIYPAAYRVGGMGLAVVCLVAHGVALVWWVRAVSQGDSALAARVLTVALGVALVVGVLLQAAARRR